MFVGAPRPVLPVARPPHRLAAADGAGPRTSTQDRSPPSMFAAVPHAGAGRTTRTDAPVHPDAVPAAPYRRLPGTLRSDTPLRDGNNMPMSRSIEPRFRPRRAYVMAAAVTGALLTAAPAAADGTPTAPDGGGAANGKPTVVLVHGAFADSSSWNGVVERLQRDGFNVIAPANPLRGLASDSAYTASVLKSIKGPIVLVGHSYGGAVISSAAAGNPQVKSLVYISAFMPDKGETLGQLAAKLPGSELNSALKPTPFQSGDGTKGTDLYIQAAKFRDVFAADLPARMTKQMAATQRPISAAAFMDKASAAAWRTIPSWALVARHDKSIAPALERFEAKRAGSHTIEIDSSHVAMLSHPDVVTNMIRAAAGQKEPTLASTGSKTLALAVTGGIAGVSVIAGALTMMAARRRRRTAS